MTYSFSNSSKFLLIFFIIFTTLLVGCRSKVPDLEAIKAVKEVMAKRQIAIHTKDIEMYKEVIFPGFMDGGVTSDAVIEDMRQIFERYEKIEFTYQRSTVDMDMNSARMVGQISYIGTGMEKKVYYRERTIFRRVDGKWTISAGIQIGML